MTLLLRSSKAQIAALLLIVLPVLLGALALGADFAVIYLNWAQIQKAADAAALAGAQQLTGQPDSSGTVAADAISYAQGYACLNGVNDPGSRSSTASTICPSPRPLSGGYADKIVFTNVNSNNTTISVGIKRQVPYSFGKLIGLNTAAVAAVATASVNPIGTIPSGLFPVGLQCTSPCTKVNLDPGQSTTFGSKFVGGLAPGNWDFVDVGQGTGASALGSAIQNGATGSFSVGSTISSSPGNKGNSGPVKKGLAARLSSCAAVNSSTDPCQNGALVGGTDGIGGTNGVPANDPCLVTLPAVDYTGCNGKCSLTIEAFAQIYLEQSSTGTEIDGCFVQQLVPKTVGSTSAPSLGPVGSPVLTQ
jgi:Flp pilus assembly protein TadG